MVKMNFLLQVSNLLVSNLTGIESSSICLYGSVIWIYYMCFVSCFITFLLIGSNLVFHLIGIVVTTMTLVFSLLLILFLLEIELISFRVLRKQPYGQGLYTFYQSRTFLPIGIYWVMFSLVYCLS